MIKIYLLAILVTFIVSCESPQNTETSTEVPLDNSVEKFEIKEVQTQYIHVGENSSNIPHQFALFNDSLLYTRTMFTPYSFDVYNLNNGKFSNRIELDKNLMKGNPHGFVIQSDGSFMTSGLGTSIIQKSNEDFTKFEIYDFSNVNMYSEESTFAKASFPAGFKGATLNMIDEDHLLVNFWILPKYDGGQNQSHVALLNLQDQTVERYYDIPDNAYTKSESRSYTNDLAMAYCTITGDTLLVSYPMDDMIYGYNLNESDIKFMKDGSSNQKIDIPAPQTRAESNDRQLSWDFRASTPYYSPLYYHSNKELFTRILAHPFDLEYVDGKMVTGRARKLSILIFDKQLNKVGETVLDNTLFDIFYHVPTSNGFFVGPSSEFINEEDSLIFNTYFELTKAN